MYGDQIWPSIFESLPYSIAKGAMHSEAFGKKGCGYFLSLIFLQNNKTVIFICQSYFTILYSHFLD
jgi:hypothetical protein